jgi:biotin-dependent carboxylase-like uncharacterized protein
MPVSARLIRWLEVVEPGPLTTVQDAGRAGLAHLGVPGSGFLDIPAAQLANRLVGNEERDALLETTMSGPTLRLPTGSQATALVAVTGAAAPVSIDGRGVNQNEATVLRPGESLSVGTARAGVRSYIAVRGAFNVSPVLGSRSTDVMSGLGPPPLTRGQRLPIGIAAHAVPAADIVPGLAIADDVEVAMSPGPSDGWFEPAAMGILTSIPWSVHPTSSRIGLRLQGPPLPRRNHSELPPEGMVTGSIQVPPDGQPLILLADRPVTGGYPVVGVVRESDLHFLAQAAPGTTVRFRSLGHPAGRQ